MKSHVYLSINAGVTLLATTDQGQYSIAYLNYPMPGTNVFPFVPTAPYEALVFAYQAVDTGILGTGTINGQGNVVSVSTNRPAGTGTGATRFEGPSYIGTTVGTPTSLFSWWTLPPPANGAALNGTTWYSAPQTDIPTSNGVTRPWLVEFYECSNVLVNGITLVNSPMWNLVLRYSSHITVTNYHVQNYSDPAATIPAMPIHRTPMPTASTSRARLLHLPPAAARTAAFFIIAIFIAIRLLPSPSSPSSSSSSSAVINSAAI